MAKISVKVESFAGSNVVNEIVALANANTPSNITPRAEVIRDANGKVIAVDVNLPVGIAHSDLASAQAAIAAHGGVAQSSAYPKGQLDTLDSLVEGQVYTGQLTLNGGLKVTLANDTGNSSSQWQGAAASESKGGTGSALRLVDTSSAFNAAGVGYWDHKSVGNIFIDPTANGLTTIGAFSLEFDVKCSATLSGAARDTGDLRHIIGIALNAPGFGSFGAAWDDIGALDSWNIGLRNHDFTFQSPMSVYMDADIVNVAPTDPAWIVTPPNSGPYTDVPDTTYVHVSMSYGLDGVRRVSLTDGTQTVSMVENVGFVQQLPGIWQLNVAATDWMSTTANMNQRPIIIDNFKLQILSGS